MKKLIPDLVQQNNNNSCKVKPILVILANHVTGLALVQASDVKQSQ